MRPLTSELFLKLEAMLGLIEGANSAYEILKHKILKMISRFLLISNRISRIS